MMFWSRRTCVRHPWWRMTKLAIVLVQVCLRAPPVVADEAKLAIVFTYFFCQAQFQQAISIAKK